MKEKSKKSNLTALAPLLIFLIFTVCILTVLLTGADIYKKISLRDQNSFQRRTTVQYLTTRIRQSDSEGMVFVGDFNAEDKDNTGDTLFLQEEINGRTFFTRIYCHEGYLYELFSGAGLETSKQYGEQILKVNDLNFTIHNNLLYIEITHADFSTDTLILQLHSKEGDN